MRNNPTADGRLSKADLTRKAYALAYEFLDPRTKWVTSPLHPDTFGSEHDAHSGPAQSAGHLEEGPDGHMRPMSREKLNYMRQSRTNLISSKEAFIPVPKDWTLPEAKLAAGILEGALFKSGLRHSVFNEPYAGGVCECHVGYEYGIAHPIIMLRTNVIGHLRTHNLQDFSYHIDATVKDIESGWSLKRRLGGSRFEKPVDIAGNFPFLNQWVEEYAMAVGQAHSSHRIAPKQSRAGYGGEAQKRYDMMLGFEIPAVGSMVIDAKLADTLKQNGFNIGTTPHRQLG